MSGGDTQRGEARPSILLRVPAHRYVRAWPRTTLAAALGLLVGLVLARGLAPPVRLIVAWDAGAACFLALVAHMMARATLEKMRKRAQTQDQGRWVILTFMVSAACISLAAIAYLLNSGKVQGAALALHLGLAGLTIVVSWLLVHTVFALHYAHLYYWAHGDSDRAASPQGLVFPSEGQPDYWDFLYYSFVVGMTCQVSDVQVTSKAMRRITLAHGVVSFFFNTVILALSINIAASVI